MAKKAAAVEAPAYRNRIVGHADVDPLDLNPHPLNWRTHDDRQRYVLKGTMEVGWVKEIIVNKRTGNIVDGHLRVSLAAEQGEPTVPVTYVDLSEAEEAMMLATLDPISELAGVDVLKLEPLLAAIETDNVAVQALLDEIAEEAGLSENIAEEDRATREATVREVVVQYNIIFDSEDHQQRWYNFLRWLRRTYPDASTVSERLALHCEHLGISEQESTEADD